MCVVITLTTSIVTEIMTLNSKGKCKLWYLLSAELIDWVNQYSIVQPWLKSWLPFPFLSELWMSCHQQIDMNAMNSMQEFIGKHMKVTFHLWYQKFHGVSQDKMQQDFWLSCMEYRSHVWVGSTFTNFLESAVKDSSSQQLLPSLWFTVKLHHTCSSIVIKLDNIPLKAHSVYFLN